MALPFIGIAGGLLVFGNFVQGVLHFYPPLWNAWQKYALSTWPNVNPQVVEMIEMLHRGEIDESEYFLKCAQFGFDEQTAQKLFNISINLLTAADYISLWRRGEITEDEANNQLYKMHFGDREIELAKRATIFYPTPTDLVRFAVREVYTPAIVEKFGTMEDLPEQFIREAGKVGLTEEHAKQFWASHWELPSAQMGFAMLHRRIISEDELKLLLRALDVMPFWRDSLVKLSYNPLTRVDVRRMYGLGVLDEEGVYNSYLDLGYSPENAERMTEFTVLYEADEYTGITRASVVSAFKKGIVSEEQMTAYLKEFGYSEEVVSFWVTMAVSEKEAEELDAFVEEVNAQYYAGLITIDEARSALAKQDIPASYISTVINKLKAKQSVKVKIPSKADLENWLKRQIIDETVYASYMQRLGYDRDVISLYLTEVALELDTKKVKYLPIKTYERWFSTGLISEGRFAGILQEMGYRQTDIQLQIQSLKPQPEA